MTQTTRMTRRANAVWVEGGLYEWGDGGIAILTPCPAQFWTFTLHVTRTCERLEVAGSAAGLVTSDEWALGPEALIAVSERTLSICLPPVACKKLPVAARKRN